MRCVRCGVNIQEPDMFCEKCLAAMDRDPIKTNITVQLPIRPQKAPEKKRSRRQKHKKPEEQIRHLRRWRRWLILLLAVALAAFAITAAMLLRTLRQPEDSPSIGQNYGTIDSSDPT